MEHKAELVPIAATELVNRINNEIDYIFKPRYTDLGAGKRTQNNAYVDMDEASKTHVVIEAMTMLLGQVGALALVNLPDINSNTVFDNIAKRMKAHGNAYHQQLLLMKEDIHDRKNQSEGTNGSDEPTKPDISGVGSKTT